MRQSALKRYQPEEATEGLRDGAVATAHPSLGLCGLPVFAPGVGERMVSHSDTERLVQLVSCLVSAGQLPDVDDGRSLTDLAVSGVAAWLETTWGRMKHFDFNFTMDNSVAQTIGVANESDLEDMCDEIRADHGVALDEPLISISVYTAGQHWLKVGAKLRELEAAAPGLGWAALNEVSNVGIHFGMASLSYLEHAASIAFWCGGDSEKEWEEVYGEPLTNYDGMTRAAFEAAFHLEECRKAEELSAKALQKLTKNEGLVGATARHLLALRRLGPVEPQFTSPACDELLDRYHQMDLGVIISFDSIDATTRLLDTYMDPYQNSGEGTKHQLGEIVLPVCRPERMIELTQQWQRTSQQLRHADALLDILGEPVE
ncbi:MAG: hypothetical protein E6R08_00900 [Nevskiaceae bacterium]|nr:MAG: hypothetical protein E6R08_00900 [Nevskiaceae bacterium]